MSTITPLVRLNGDVLDVDDEKLGLPNKPGIGIPRGQGLHLIVWTLDNKSLPGGAFLPIDDKDEELDGFTMISSPQKGWFSKAWVPGGGRHLIVQVDHAGDASKGDFIYMLRARDSSGIVHSTLYLPDKKDCRTVTNPIIINK
jgi:hypothetical protein